MAGARKSCKENGCVVLQFTSAVIADVAASVILLISALQLNFFLFALRAALLALGGVLALRCGRGQCRGGTRGSPRLFAGGDVQLLSLQASHAGSGVGDTLDLELADRRAADEEAALHKWKADLVMALLFVCVTVESVYTGVQISSFARSSQLLVAAALCATVFCMNIEAFLLKKLVSKLLTPDGEVFPHIHEHPLFYVSAATFDVCSICRERFGTATGGYERWECRTCDSSGGGKGMGKGVGKFSMCMLCYRKQLMSSNVQEGVLRGDKGPKPSPELGPSQYLMRTARLAAPFKLNLVSALLSIVISTMASVLLPNQQGQVINSLVASDAEKFRAVLVNFVILSVAGALFKSMMSLTVNIVSRQLTLGIRTDMFKSIMKQDMAFFDGMMTGQLTSRMTNDVNAVTQPIVQILTVTMANAITLVGGSFMCFYTSWRLTMLALTMIGPVIYLTGVYARWSKGINMTVRAALGDSNAVATESFRNIRTVRSFGATQIETEVFEGHVGEAWKNMRKDAYASAGVGAISGYVNFAAGVLVYWYGGQAVLHGTDEQLNIGNLITFNMYWNMLGTSINSLNSTLNTLVVAASAAKRVYEIIDLEPDIAIDDQQALALEDVVPVGRAPTLEFCSVQFTYQMRPDKKVFSDLSFKIPAGSTVAFVGKSGCGKSTTMQLLLRFYDPQAGAILVEGRPLTAYNLRSYQRRVAVVSQETQIFARSVKDNLTYGMKPEDYDDAAIEAAARQANAHEFIMAMDRGYDSMLGESGGRISGGQKQRLSIARAFLRKPQLLLLDEATSALDSENEKQIQKALDDMVQAMAGTVSVVIIAHRLSTVMGADNILVFDGGAISEQGNHERLMEHDGIYASLVRRQQAKEASKGGEAENEEDGGSSDGAKGKGKGKGKAKESKGKSVASIAEGGGLALESPGEWTAEGKGKKGKGKKGAGVPAGDEAWAAGGEAAEWPGSGGAGKGKGCKFWHSVSLMPQEERKDKVQQRLQHVLDRAIRHAGTDAVSDAFVDCLREAFLSEKRLESETDASSDDGARRRGPPAQEQPSDSIAELFREVQRKARLGGGFGGGRG